MYVLIKNKWHMVDPSQQVSKPAHNCAIHCS